MEEIAMQPQTRNTALLLLLNKPKGIHNEI